MNKQQQLEAARNLEPDDCNIAAVGNGRYTRQNSEQRRYLSLGPPTFTEEDNDGDNASMTTWCFGPQGHPASLRMTLYVTDATTELWVQGPWILHRHEIYKDNFSKHMDLTYAQGTKVMARFGEDPFWHRCKEGCYGFESARSKCRACAQIRTLSEQASRDFWRDLL